MVGPNTAVYISLLWVARTVCGEHLHQAVPKHLKEEVGSLPDRQLPILHNLQKKEVTRQNFRLALPYVELAAIREA